MTLNNTKAIFNSIQIQCLLFEHFVAFHFNTSILMLRPPMVSEAWFDFATRGAAQPLVDDSVTAEEQSWNIRDS